MALSLLADNEEATDSYRAKVLLAVFNLKMYNKLLEGQLQQTEVQIEVSSSNDKVSQIKKLQVDDDNE